VTANRGRSCGRVTALRPGTAVRFAVVLVLAASVFFPVYTAFASAFSENGSIARSGIFPGLHELTFDNFRQAVASVDVIPEYLVSLAVVSLQALGQLFTSALAAYALVFPRWRGRGLAFGLVLLTIAVPGESIVIPNYELVSRIGLQNTILGVALPYLAAGYPIFLLRQAFSAVPGEMWEAARLDGCGDIRALFAVVVPACRPQVTTAAVWSALAAWNGFFWPLLITNTASARTIQVGISQLAGVQTPPSVVFAGSVLVVAPTMVLVICAQQFLVNNFARRIAQ
jgi:sn-glycerol 3-phosphate transport system permease protein